MVGVVKRIEEAPCQKVDGTPRSQEGVFTSLRVSSETTEVLGSLRI